jgi:flavin reductase (DIM6/NTAB) family NADH-FMN oxidoreductase RutF
MVGESPINMECKLVQIIEFGEIPAGANVVIGEVILVHIRDELWANDHIEISKLKVIGRLGGDMYCRMTDVFEMKRPNKNL